MRLGERRLLVAADRADHGGAEMLRPLADDEADPAGGGVDQDGLARLHHMGAADQVPRGHALEHHRRGLLVGDAVGHRHQPVGRHHPRLGIGAERPAGIGDAVAGLEAADAGPDLLDDAGALAAEAARQRHRVEAAALIGVDVVEADRGVPEPHLAGAGLADLDLLPVQHLGAAGLLETDRLHHGLGSSAKSVGRKACRRF